MLSKSVIWGKLAKTESVDEAQAIPIIHLLPLNNV